VGDVQEQAATSQTSSHGLRMADVKPKMRFDGTVKQVELFGAFVDIGAEKAWFGTHLSTQRGSRQPRRRCGQGRRSLTVWVKQVDPAKV